MNKKTETHKVNFWIVVTDNMRQNGYDDLEALFHQPTNLDALDECREYTAELPKNYVVAAGQNGINDLYDYDNDMCKVLGLVDHNETMLATEPIDKMGIRYGHVLIDFHIKLVQE